MAITLAQFKVGLQSKVDQKVVDIIQRNSYLMDKMTFDDAITSNGSGSTLTYGYVRTKTPVSGKGRALNTEYTASTAEREPLSTDLQIMGSAYEIDRVLAKNVDARINEVAYQTEEHTKGTIGLFQYLAINGDKTNPNEFDGLAKLLAGTTNEIDASTLDVSATMTAAKAEEFCEAVDEMIASLDGTDNVVILGNKKTIGKLNAAARMLNYHSQERDEFGRTIDKYGDYPLVDLKEFFNGTSTVDVVPVTSSGTTCLYAVRLALNGFHAVTPKGGIGLDVISPDFKAEGAVHKGEVELVGAVVLKSTRAAAVLKDIKVK